MGIRKTKAASANTTVRLSKTRISHGLVCEKKAYLGAHSPELSAKASKALLARYDSGNDVGEQARLLWPGGALVDCEYWEVEQAQSCTKELVESGTKTIYEAAFGNDLFHCRIDILNRESAESRWNVYEVKSGVDAKSEYIFDLAIQCWILSNLGVQWDRAYIVYLNRECRYPDLSNLFLIEDVTNEVKAHRKHLDNDTLRLSEIVNQATAPEKDIGRHCVEPYKCGFIPICWKEVPEYSVFDLPRGWTLFDKGKLRLSDVDPDDLTDSQRVPYRSLTEDYFYFNKTKVKRAINKWKFPIYHLDFETINPAIPMFNGTGPYEQIPFQFSLHIQTSPGTPPRHHEFLQSDGADPRQAVAEALCRWIPKDAETVMAFNSRFEKRVLKHLAEMYPNLSELLLSIVDKMVDPLPIIRANIYHKDFRGSFSLKEIAPSLLGPKWGYELLEVSDGQIAQLAFREMVTENTPANRKQLLRAQLLAYCAHDTLTMVELVNWLFGKTK